MRALDGENMLLAWDRCRERHPQESALALLALAEPGLSPEQLARLPLARRNARLLELRALTLGRRMQAFALCPECGAQLEFTLDASAMARGLDADPEEMLSDDLAMRPVDTRDLLASLGEADAEQAQTLVLARTLGFAERAPADADCSPAEWLRRVSESIPQAGQQAMTERFDRLNASAEIRMQVECAACHGTPVLDLDIARYLVREISAAARRLMGEIHELAFAYGWGEHAIASMSGARRAAYLEMLQT